MLLVEDDAAGLARALFQRGDVAAERARALLTARFGGGVMLWRDFFDKVRRSCDDVAHRDVLS